MTVCNHDTPVHIHDSGLVLLEDPLLNKGTAFSELERTHFKLHGLLPEPIESIDIQLTRAYQQFGLFENPLDRYIYLRNLQDTNETLFYRLVQSHLSEMMPIIYTPTVGQACQQFSHIFRRARGLFISYPNRHNLDAMLQNISHRDIKIVVVTDGERILGLGDQGAGGMGIPIGKLSLYTVCGGIDPAHTMPIFLDVGTNNAEALSDPLYLGWRHPRIDAKEYAVFVDQFVNSIQRHWPQAVLQFEDFAQKNAMALLDRYQNKLCCFNDDIQGTAATVLGCLMAASRASGVQLSQQHIVFMGSGSAGCGIAELVVSQMQIEGISELQARSQIYMLGSKGLLTDQMPDLPSFKSALAQKVDNVAHWRQTGTGIDRESNWSLWDVVHHAKPGILIGVSGKPGLFTERVIREMYRHCSQPIIMPLSNPTSHTEAHPCDLFSWTNGAALVATGSPFDPVHYDGTDYPIAQCNNAYLFPGLGLGLLACKATKVTPEMLLAAGLVLAAYSPMARTGRGPLLPPLSEIQQVSRAIGLQVAKTAQQQGVAVTTMRDEQLVNTIEQNFWQPTYRPYFCPSMNKNVEAISSASFVGHGDA